MKEREKDALLLRRSKQLLDDCREQTDSDVLRKLRLARSAALECPQKKSFGWVPATGLAALCVAVLIFVFRIQQPVGNDMVKGFGDIELLASSESLDFYEDLEFYRWLAEEQGAG